MKKLLLATAIFTLPLTQVLANATIELKSTKPGAYVELSSPQKTLSLSEDHLKDQLPSGQYTLRGGNKNKDNLCGGNSLSCRFDDEKTYTIMFKQDENTCRFSVENAECEAL